MEKIWNILNWAISKYNLWKATFSLLVSWRVKNHLLDFFWEQVFKFIKIEKVKDWIIFIKVKNSSWAQEIQLISNDLLLKTREDFKNENLIAIKIYT